MKRLQIFQSRFVCTVDALTTGNHLSFFYEFSCLLRYNFLFSNVAFAGNYRNQILISKHVIKGGDDTWNSISRNKQRALWVDAIHEINKKFMIIANSASRPLSGQVTFVICCLLNLSVDFIIT